MLQTCQVAVRCVVGLGPTNFNKRGHRAAACHANFACCGQLLQNFLASPRKSVVSPSRLPRPGVEGNIPTDDLTYILDCDLTYTAPSGDVTLGSHATSCRNRAEPGVSHADLHTSSTSTLLPLNFHQRLIWLNCQSKQQQKTHQHWSKSFLSSDATIFTAFSGEVELTVRGTLLVVVRIYSTWLLQLCSRGEANATGVVRVYSQVFIYTR
jgi:hypothetical protein